MNQNYPHYRRNFAAIAGDWICFIVAMAFANYATVLPSFVNQLTNFAPLVGLVSTIYSGAWLLPQLFAANYVTSKERKKPYVITVALIARPMLMLVGMALLLTGDTRPSFILAFFFVGYTIFMVADGVSSVGWFDIVSKSIPPARRGRLFSTGQVVGGLLAVGAGFVVKQILGPQGPAFPHNYSLIFLLASTFLLLGLLFLSRLKEPTQPVRQQRQPWRSYAPQLAAVLRQDRQFALVNVVRLLSALGGLSLPFYVIYATGILQVGDESIGLFVSAQVAGAIAASSAMGYLNERSGSRIVTIVTIASGLGAPLLALLIHYRAPQPDMITYIYALVFALVGANYSGNMQGFINMVLEMAPPSDRPTYVGLYNTLAGAVNTVAPLVGGWVLQSTSFPVLFGAAAVAFTCSLALSFRLDEPRRR